MNQLLCYLEKHGILLCNQNPLLPSLEDIGCSWSDVVELIDNHQLFYCKVFQKRTTYLSAEAYYRLKQVRTPSRCLRKPNRSTPCCWINRRWIPPFSKRFLICLLKATDRDLIFCCKISLSQRLQTERALLPTGPPSSMEPPKHGSKPLPTAFAATMPVTGCGKFSPARCRKSCFAH